MESLYFIEYNNNKLRSHSSFTLSKLFALGDHQQVQSPQQNHQSSMVSSNGLNFHPKFCNFSELSRSLSSITTSSFLFVKLPFTHLIRPDRYLKVLKQTGFQLFYLSGKFRLGYIFLSISVRESS